MVELKSNLSKLKKMKNQSETGIAEEKRIKTSYKAELKNLEQEYNELQGMWGIFNAVLGWSQMMAEAKPTLKSKQALDKAVKAASKEEAKARVQEAHGVVQER